MLGTRSMTLSSELECDLDRNLRAGDVEVLLALEVKVPPSDKCGQTFLLKRRVKQNMLKGCTILNNLHATFLEL